MLIMCLMSHLFQLSQRQVVQQEPYLDKHHPLSGIYLNCRHLGRPCVFEGKPARLSLFECYQYHVKNDEEQPFECMYVLLFLRYCGLDTRRCFQHLVYVQVRILGVDRQGGSSHQVSSEFSLYQRWPSHSARCVVWYLIIILICFSCAYLPSVYPLW